MKRHAWIECGGAATLTLLASGCQMMDTAGQMAASVGQSTGYLTEQQAQSVTRSASAVGKTFDDITPEQEYYLGRAVAATVLNEFKPFDRAAANHYLNVLGQALALHSDRPETFGGYHFLLMDTDTINAFAAPGGLILVSRGLIRCCPDENALAAVLAHEVAHVELKHGLRAIKSGRLTSALTTLATESAKSLGGQDLAQLTEAFEGSITDITSTLMNSGYSRKLEFEADDRAIAILQRTGYDPAGLVIMLQEMQQRLVPNRHDFGATHPPPTARIERLQARPTAAGGSAGAHPVRQSRFQEAMKGV